MYFYQLQAGTFLKDNCWNSVFTGTAQFPGLLLSGGDVACTQLGILLLGGGQEGPRLLCQGTKSFTLPSEALNLLETLQKHSLVSCPRVIKAGGVVYVPLFRAVHSPRRRNHPG